MTPTDLEALRERVRTATGPDREIDGALALLAGWTHEKMKGDGQPYWRKPGVTTYYNRSDLPSYTASLDAALGLVERMLPGFDYILEHTNGGLTISCLLGTADPDKRAWGNTMPLAVLDALLSALIAQKVEG